MELRLGGPPSVGGYAPRLHADLRILVKPLGGRRPGANVGFAPPVFRTGPPQQCGEGRRPILNFFSALAGTFGPKEIIEIGLSFSSPQVSSPSGG